MSPSTDQREHREFAAEIKFIISPGLATEVLAWARRRLAADPNAASDTGDTYPITSLYFDTADFDVYERRGSFGRSKYRVRRYGEGPDVFLERKLKTRGLLAKRRSIVAGETLSRLEDPAAEPGWAGWWFHRRLVARGLRPVCQIRYERAARVAMTPGGPIRLTLDQGVRAWPRQHVAFAGADAGRPVLRDQAILELKYRRSLPRLFKLLIEEFALNPRPVSKYRLAFEALALREGAPREQELAYA